MQYHHGEGNTIDEFQPPATSPQWLGLGVGVSTRGWDRGNWVYFNEILLFFDYLEKIEVVIRCYLG
jgi:hypothetical protein